MAPQEWRQPYASPKAAAVGRGGMKRRKATVELFEEIRREYEFGVGTIAGVARKFGVHRRLVREALAGAMPRERAAAPRARPKTGAVAAFVETILEADRRAPRQQRPTPRPP